MCIQLRFIIAVRFPNVKKEGYFFAPLRGLRGGAGRVVTF